MTSKDQQNAVTLIIILLVAGAVVVVAFPKLPTTAKIFAPLFIVLFLFLWIRKLVRNK